MKVSMTKTKPDKSIRPSFQTKDLTYPDWLKKECDEHYDALLEAERTMWGNVQLLHPDMLNGKGVPNFLDPSTGTRRTAKITEVRWLERGFIKRKGKTVESLRPVKLNPNKLTEVQVFTLGKLKESLKTRAFNKLKETDFFSLGLDQPVSSSITGIYLPMPPGPYTKQLYLQSMWKMQAEAFWLKNHDPILHGAISTLTAFVIGKGVGIEFEDERAQAVWDEFEERTEFQRRLPIGCDTLSTDGELMWYTPEVIGPTGFPALDLITLDNGTIWEIITDPKDIRKVYGYWRQYPTQYQIFTVEGVPMIEYVLEILPADQVIHMKVNVQEVEKRGRSDLLSSLSDAAMLRDITRYKAIKVMNESALCFDETIKGDDTDVTKLQNANRTFLGAGTWHTHNESSELKTLQWSGAGDRKSGITDEMLGRIGQGTAGVPKEYLGGGDSASRATALTSTEPFAKLVARRQTEFETPIKRLAKKIIAHAIMNGVATSDISDKCEITFPEIAPQAAKDKLANIALCQSQGWFKKERCAELAAKEMDVTEFNYLEEKVVMDQEKATDPLLQAAMYPGGVSPIAGSPPSAAPAEPSMAMTPADKDGLRTDLQARESQATSTSVPLVRLKPFSMNHAYAENERMKAAGFKLAESDQSIPAEWKPVVNRLKKHSDISEPHALINWMDSQGYSPKGK